MQDTFIMEYELRLPGGEDFDQHYTTGQQIRQLPNYELDEAAARIEINDPVWGECTIGEWPGDEVFLDLYRHPVFQRLAAIEQLTLPKHYATMPGSVEFTRWEHAWGSVVFVRTMIEQAEAEGREFDPREKVILQLRTLVSDAGQTAFSHLGDWLKQGFGGSEDSHDQTLEEFLEETGVNTLLRTHNVDPKDVIFPDKEDWIECKSPDLCVDRVDYGIREISRWVLPGFGRDWKYAFTLDSQNRLVMKNHRSAKIFASAFGLLATEHWSHPVHRMQLAFFGELIKGALTEEEDYADLSDDPEQFGLHPFDELYGVDEEIIAKTRQIGELNNGLHAQMLDIARAQRRVFAWGRERSITNFMQALQHDNTPDSAHFPDPLSTDTWVTQYSGTQPQNVELIPVTNRDEVSDFGTLPHSLDMYLTSLKPRAVDPLFRDENGETKRLSEADPHFAGLLAEHRAIQAQKYVARLHMSPSAVTDLRQKLSVVAERWEKRLERPRSVQSQESLRDRMRSLGFTAIYFSPNDIQIRRDLPSVREDDTDECI